MTLTKSQLDETQVSTAGATGRSPTTDRIAAALVFDEDAGALSLPAVRRIADRIERALAELGKDTQPPADWKERVLASAGHWLEAKERDVLIKLRMQTPAGGLNREEIAVLDQLIASPVIGASVEASVYHVVRRLADEVLAATFPNAPDHCARAAHTIATLISLDTTPATRVVPSPPGQDG